MARQSDRTTLAMRCGRVGLTATVGVAALLAVIALPVPIDQGASRPAAPFWRVPLPESETDSVPAQPMLFGQAPSGELAAIPAQPAAVVSAQDDWVEAPHVGPRRCASAVVDDGLARAPRRSRCGTSVDLAPPPGPGRRRCGEMALAQR